MRCCYQHPWLPVHTWLPVLAAAAALTLGVSAMHGETPVPMPQTPPLSSIQAPADSPSQPAVIVGKPATSIASSSTPEDQGDALLGQQRYQAAIESYKKASPASADVYNKMGIAYQMMFNLTDASRCYQESLRMDRMNPRVMNNLGDLRIC